MEDVNKLFGSLDDATIGVSKLYHKRRQPSKLQGTRLSKVGKALRLQSACGPIHGPWSN
jgi:hypothetical protein